MHAVAAASPSREAASLDDGRQRSPVPIIVWLAVVAVAAGAGLAVAYRGGLKVAFGDPIVYVSVARSLANGHGISVPYGSIYTASQSTLGGPVSHWPPAYSMLLSIAGSSVLTWARVLGVVLFSANVFLFGFLSHRLGVARLGSIALAVIFAGLSFPLHGTVESEPLFFFLVLLGLHALATFFDRPAMWSLLLVAVAFGLSTVTRYLGEAFVIGAVLTILILLKESAVRRLMYAAVLAVVGNIPVLIWFASIHNSPESPAVHLPKFYDLQTALYAFAGFIIPGVQSSTLRILIAGAIVVLVIAVLATVGGSRTLAPVRRERVDWVLLYLVVAYLVFLFASRAVVDPLIQLNARMLFLPFALLLLWCAQNWPRLASWSAEPRSSWAPPVATCLVVLLVITACWTAFEDARQVQDGNLNSPAATNTALKRAVNDIPPTTVIYSDHPDGVYFVSGRRVYLLPTTASAETLKANHRFPAQMSALKRAVCGRSAIVLFASSHGYVEPSLKMVEHYLKIDRSASLPGWTVLTLDTAPPC